MALLRPTLSPGLYYQMVGRGFRLHPGKTDCLVLDFGGNVVRHGPVDQLVVEKRRKQNNKDSDSPAKECPNCRAIIAAGYAVCPDCNYEFPEPNRQAHDSTATDAGIISGQITVTDYDVEEVFYSVHTKRGAPPDAPKTLRVEYRIGFQSYVSEWVCFEHTGYAHRKAESWWKARSYEPVPASADEAVEAAETGDIATPRKISVQRQVGDKYDRIVNCEFDDISHIELDAAIETDAECMLAESLTGGPIHFKHFIESASSTNLPWPAIRRAYHKLGIQSRRGPEGELLWMFRDAIEANEVIEQPTLAEAPIDPSEVPF